MDTELAAGQDSLGHPMQNSIAQSDASSSQDSRTHQDLKPTEKQKSTKRIRKCRRWCSQGTFSTGRLRLVSVWRSLWSNLHCLRFALLWMMGPLPSGWGLETSGCVCTLENEDEGVCSPGSPQPWSDTHSLNSFPGASQGVAQAHQAGQGPSGSLISSKTHLVLLNMEKNFFISHD